MSPKERPDPEVDPREDDHDGENGDESEGVGYSITPLSEGAFDDEWDDENESGGEGKGVKRLGVKGVEGVLAPPTREFLEAMWEEDEDDGPKGLSATDFLEARTVLRSLSGLLPNVEVSSEVRAAIMEVVSGDLSQDEVLTENPEEVLSAIGDILKVLGVIPR